MKPEVSIIIPVYNPGYYLRLAIDSVLQQDHQNWELIVVDDGSPEDVSYVAGIDPRILFLQQKNGGQAKARNAGAARATGEFIAFLDQDDVWGPEKLSAQVRAMRANPGLLLVHTQFRFIDSDGALGALGFGRQQSYLEMQEGSGLCSASMVLMETSAFREIGGFDPGREPVEDTALFLRVTQAGETLFLPECHVFYRMHSKNQSKDYKRSYEAMRSLLLSYATTGNTAVARAAQRGLRTYRRVYGAQAFDHARICLRQGDWADLWRHLFFVSCKAPDFLLISLFSYFSGIFSKGKKPLKNKA